MLRKGLPLEAALANSTRDLEKPEDRALVHAMTAETLRRLPDLDALIDSATRQRLPDDAKARMVLRLALVQALALDTPPHAAIATSLPLVDGGPRKLVHGVFGALMRKGVRLPETPTLPDAVRERWGRQWSGEMVEAASRLVATPPPIDLAFAPDRPPQIEGESLLPGHLRLPRGTAVAGLSGYGEGGWWVQDIAASLPARLLGEGKGRSVLDLCAAPGGKTMQLASAGFVVTAVDASQSRLARLSENMTRTGLEAKVVAADIMKWEPEEPVDAILLDAPCSATGIFRRHPEVMHRVRQRAIAELAEQQAAMLKRAAGWLKPGGTLLYSVCSLEREEGEQVADRFVSQNADYSPDPIRAAELPAALRANEHWLRILPGAWLESGGADSFFIARFRRNSRG